MVLLSRTRRGVALVATCVALAGCSVWMSANRQSYKGDPAVIQVGADRARIEAALGPPHSLVSLPDGRARAVYKLDPNAADAALKGAATGFNFVADVVTIGLWEVVATPVELASADKIINFLITYGTDNKVESLETFKD